jgi:hypothetical protein
MPPRPASATLSSGTARWDIITLPDKEVDVVISDCVSNLPIDKPVASEAIFTPVLPPLSIGTLTI